MQIPRASILLLGLSACLAVQAAENRIPVLNQNQMGDWWGVPAGSQLASPGYPQQYAGGRAPVCMAIGYLLNADGTTSDFGVLKSWSAAEPTRGREAYWRAFAKEAASAMSQWRFVPMPGNDGARPIYTVATFLFAPTNADELAKHCEIPSLSEHILVLSRIDHVRLRMSNSDIFSRLEISPSMELARTSRLNEARLQRINQQMRHDAQRPAQPTPPPGDGNEGGGSGSDKPGGG